MKALQELIDYMNNRLEKEFSSYHSTVEEDLQYKKANPKAEGKYLKININDIKLSATIFIHDNINLGNSMDQQKLFQIVILQIKKGREGKK